MLKGINYSVVLGAVFLALFGAAYLNFTQYKPKVLTEVREVKGARVSSLNLPKPLSAKLLSDTSISNNYQQMTIETPDTANKVKEFYDNVFLSKDWRIDKQGMEGEFYITKYRKDDESIYVSTSNQTEGNTLITIEIIKSD